MPGLWPGSVMLLFAERAGFEPAIPFRVYTLSRRAPSTTRTPLRLKHPYSKPSGLKHSLGATQLRAAKVQTPDLDSEYFLGIFRRHAGHFFLTYPLDLRQLSRYILQIAALITLAPVRHRAQVGRIRLQHHV